MSGDLGPGGSWEWVEERRYWRGGIRMTSEHGFERWVQIGLFYRWRLALAVRNLRRREEKRDRALAKARASLG